MSVCCCCISHHYLWPNTELCAKKRNCVSLTGTSRPLLPLPHKNMCFLLRRSVAVVVRVPVTLAPSAPSIPGPGAGAGAGAGHTRRRDRFNKRHNGKSPSWRTTQSKSKVLWWTAATEPSQCTTAMHHHHHHRVAVHWFAAECHMSGTHLMDARRSLSFWASFYLFCFLLAHFFFSFLPNFRF